MTRASDTAKLLGAGATILDGTTISTADNTAQLELVSTDADSGIGPHQVFYRNSASPADADLLCELDFRGRNDNSQDVNYATVNVKASDVSDGTEDGEYILQVMTAGSVDTTMHIKPSEIVFNEDSIDRDFRVEGNGEANLLLVDAGEDNVKIGSSAGNYGKFSIRNEAAGAQERGLYVEVAPASGTSPNNVAVFSAANGNLTTPVVRIHHESPTADQLLIQATTTGSNTVKFSVDEDGDIYSAGGINLGGTGSANKLDDYEEGTWTPTVTGSSSGSYALDAGHKSTYIKVGNICHISTSFGLGTLTGTASGFIVIAGFPFNYNGGVSQSTGACFLSRANLADTHKQTHIMQSSSGTANTFFLPFMRDNDTSGESDLSIFSSSSNITFSFSYQTV